MFTPKFYTIVICDVLHLNNYIILQIIGNYTIWHFILNLLHLLLEFSITCNIKKLFYYDMVNIYN